MSSWRIQPRLFGVPPELPILAACCKSLLGAGRAYHTGTVLAVLHYTCHEAEDRGKQHKYLYFKELRTIDRKEWRTNGKKGDASPVSNRNNADKLVAVGPANQDTWRMCIQGIHCIQWKQSS